jgi:hypothetical protein
MIGSGDGLRLDRLHLQTQKKKRRAFNPALTQIRRVFLAY